VKFADNVLARAEIYSILAYGNWIGMVNFRGSENGRANRLADFIAGIGEFNIAVAILFGYDRYDFDA